MDYKINDDVFVMRVSIKDPRAVFYETHRLKNKPFRHDTRLCMVTNAELIGDQVNFTIEKLPPML